MTQTLQTALRRLRLSGMAASLDIRLQEARGAGLNHEEFLELVVQDELTVRRDRLMARRIKVAAFRERKTLEDFDWRFNPSVQRKVLYELATCRFIREARDVLLVGPPGVGKSHLAQALGYEAIKAGHTVLYRSIFDLVRRLAREEAFEDQDRVMARLLKADLLIIDDMGLRTLPRQSGEHLFEIILRRHQLRSTVMTSNRPLEDWGNPVSYTHLRAPRD